MFLALQVLRIPAGGRGFPLVLFNTTKLVVVGVAFGVYHLPHSSYTVSSSFSFSFFFKASNQPALSFLQRLL